jgi:hypothetical protein
MTIDRAWNIIGCLAVFGFIAAGPTLLRLGSGDSASSTRPSAIEITYRVSGTASSASVLFANGKNGYDREKTSYGSQGEMRFYRNVTLPIGQHPQISATSNDSSGGTVRVEIWYRGQLANSAESSGPFAMADTTAIIQ